MRSRKYFLHIFQDDLYKRIYFSTTTTNYKNPNLIIVFVVTKELLYGLCYTYIYNLMVGLLHSFLFCFCVLFCSILVFFIRVETKMNSLVLIFQNWHF
jgi:hypothetical protein